MKIFLLSITFIFFNVLLSPFNCSATYSEVDYSIKQKNTDQVIDCRSFAVKIDENAVQCADRNSQTIYIFAISDINVYYKNIKIYPYEWSLQKIKDSIKEENCEKIISNLYGPYFIDNDPKSYVSMGWILENGICIAKDENKAISLYEKILSDSPSQELLEKKIIALKVKVSKKNIQILDKYNVITECSAIEIGDDRLACSNDQQPVAYISKTDVGSIYHNKALIFPYDTDWEKKVSTAIDFKDCPSVKKNLYGPLFVDNLPPANLIMAKLLENGFCESQNKPMALNYYKEALNEDYSFVSKKIESLSVEIAEEERRRKEEEAKRKLAAQAEEQKKEAAEKEAYEYIISVDIKCQQDCSTNKYQYNTSCYSACWDAHGLDLVDRAKLVNAR